MTAALNTASTGDSMHTLVDALNLVLADTYALMALTQFAHWNVEGRDFFSLHAAFEEQYDALFEAVDEVAERVRALKGYALGGLGNLAKAAGIPEFSAPMSAVDMVTALAAGHRKTLGDAVQARDLAGQLGDAQSQDLMIERITAHEKTLWMLESYLK